MAEILPNEGKDYLIGVVFKNSPAAPATLYLGMFTGTTATTVPAESSVLATPSGFAEAAYSGYARKAIAAASWGALATILSGRGITGPAVAFDAATGASATAINGFFIATTSGTGTGISLGYANFAEGNVPSVAVNDIITVTPQFALLG